jgi:hypothetical protein
MKVDEFVIYDSRPQKVCCEGELSIEAKRVWSGRVNALNFEVKEESKLINSSTFVEVCVNENLRLLSVCLIFLC